jgi:hypothetical protein
MSTMPFRIIGLRAARHLTVAGTSLLLGACGGASEPKAAAAASDVAATPRDTALLSARRLVCRE